MDESFHLQSAFPEIWLYPGIELFIGVDYRFFLALKTQVLFF